MEKKYTPCGGCGATAPIERCIGCFHPFEATLLLEPKIETAIWLNLANHFTEDWEIMHCRFADDKRKLDTDLFELRDEWLVKKGGTGKIKLHEVEYMAETKQATPQGIGWVSCSVRMPEIDSYGDYPKQYIMKCKWDGSRGNVDIKHVTAEAMVDVIQGYDYCEWLDEGQPQPEKEIAFAEWAMNEGWVCKKGIGWMKHSNETPYVLTTAELWEVFKREDNP